MLYSGERKRANKEKNPRERLSQVASRKAKVAQLKPCYISKRFLSVDKGNLIPIANIVSVYLKILWTKPILLKGKCPNDKPVRLVNNSKILKYV